MILVNVNVNRYALRQKFSEVCLYIGVCERWLFSQLHGAFKIIVFVTAFVSAAVRVTDYNVIKSYGMTNLTSLRLTFDRTFAVDMRFKTSTMMTAFTWHVSQKRHNSNVNVPD